MNTVAGRLLGKARALLSNASVALGVGLTEDAGRNAYLAGYNAARAYLYVKESRIYKTHNGLQSGFSRLAKDDPCFTPEARKFLSQAYNLKQIADYEDGPNAKISPERAAGAIDTGLHFIACCENAIKSSDQQDS